MIDSSPQSNHNEGNLNDPESDNRVIYPDILASLDRDGVPYLDNLLKVWPVLKVLYGGDESGFAEDIATVLGAIELEVGKDEFKILCFKLAGRNVADRISSDKGFKGDGVLPEHMKTFIGSAVVNETDPQVLACINGLNELSWYVLKRMYRQLIGKASTHLTNNTDPVKKLFNIISADIEDDVDPDGKPYFSVRCYPLWLLLAPYQRRFVSDRSRWGSYLIRNYGLDENMLLEQLILNGAQGITGPEFEQAGQEAAMMGKALHKLLAMVWDGRIYSHASFTDLKDAMSALYPTSSHLDRTDVKRLFRIFRERVLSAAQVKTSARYLDKINDPNVKNVMKLLGSLNEILGTSFNIDSYDQGALERLINMLAIVAIELANPLIDHNTKLVLTEINVNAGRIDNLILPKKVSGKSEILALFSPVTDGAEQSYANIADILKILERGGRRLPPIIIIEIKTSINQRGRGRPVNQTNLSSLVAAAKSLNEAGVDLTRVSFLFVSYVRTGRAVTQINAQQLLSILL